ncbi:DNA repair protein [Ktedonobacter sp. SOSP1-52]|uniref:metallophosphoesterase family protein n=1 Tax=Ktedonobacter sp. SOSP1-52 TaxID=2778366 RepID=UPI0019150E13|nr:exonuclease SbcCD subunit D [Ktedonobacter sp. SOSP1-52]GHO69429.1 DNA repair protein [Ktedonobacter sp. SOSP1-52]
MRASFIHCADTHLGYEQYGVRERFNDFTWAFWELVDEAIERRVDFMVIAGDLFNKRAIDALTLIHAIEGLKKLKDANIPVIAIEGNHDRSYYREGTSWLQFLCYQGYLVLLQPRMVDGMPQLEPWDQQNMLGAYVDLLDGNLRVYGIHWLGSSTSRALEGMSHALQDARADEDASGVAYRLLMMHTGIDGMVARIQGLPTMAQFQALSGQVDYLALGHVHKPYEFDGWIYNPGSTETCSAEEVQWEDRGYYYVEIDTDEPGRIINLEKKERIHHAERLKSTRRPFVRHEIRVDGLNEPEDIYLRLESYCQDKGPAYAQTEKPPVVQVTLSGTLAFDAGSLDISRMEEMLRQYFNPLHARIDNHTSDQDYEPDEGDLDGRDRSLWHELERHIFEELLARDNRFLTAKEQWSNVLADIKAQALRKEEPAQIAQYLRDKRTTLLTPEKS